MLLLESGDNILLEGGVDRLTEETPPYPGDLLTEQGIDRVMLENGADSLLREESAASPQTLDVSFISSGSQTFAPSVVQVVQPALIASGSQQFSPTVVQNAPNNAFRISGEQDALMLATVPNTNSITFVGWARIVTDRNTYSSIFSIETGPGHSTEWNELITETDGTTLSVYDHVTGNVGTVGVMTVGVWYRVAIVFGPGTAWKSYFGTEGSAPLTTQTGTKATISAVDYAGVGGTQFTSTEWFNGRLAHFRVWNAVLTDAEIEREFRSDVPIRTSDLLGAWFPRSMTAGTVLTAISGSDLVDGNGGGTPDYTVEAGPIIFQQMDPPVIGPGTTLFAPEVQTGSQNLVVPLLASTATFYAPSVVQNVAPGLHGPTSTLYAPSVVQLVQPPLIGSSSALFAPSVVQVVTPGLHGPTSQLFGPSVTNLNTLVAPLIGSTEQTFAPSVVQVVAPPLIGPGTALFAPTLTNLNTLLPGLLGPDTTLYGPSVVQVVQPPLIGPTSQTFAPSVVQVVSPPLLGPTSQTFAPTLTNLNTIVAPLIGSTETLYSPTIAQITLVQPPLIGSTEALYSPTVTNLNTLEAPVIGPNTALFGPSVVMEVEPPLLGPNTQLFAPSLSNLNTLLAPFIPSGSQTFAPSVVQVVSPPVIPAGSQTYAPSVTQIVSPPILGPDTALYPPTIPAAGTTLLPPAIGPNSVTYAPSVSNVNTLTPPLIGAGEVLYAPSVSNLNTLLAPFIGPTAALYEPSVIQNVQPPAIPSGETLYPPAISTLLTAPLIGPTETLYEPTVISLNALLAPFIPSGSQTFAPSVVQIVQPPIIPSGSVLYSPNLLKGEGWPEPTPTIPLIRTLELPLPATVSRILGIHQSDIVIRSAVVAALADMRANPWLLDYVFASLPQDTLTWKEYGERDLQQAKKWFLSTNIEVSVLPRFNESQWPQITIELLESTEVVPEAIIGDVNYDPTEDNDMTWPALTQSFVPISYTPSTGLIRLAADCEAWLGPGMFIIDRQGKSHEITEVTDQRTFKIDPGTVADFRSSVIKGHRPNWKVDVESSSFKETYRLGVHCQGETVHLTWLHAIVQFALLRYKQVLLEARGFERSTISSSQVSLDQRFETENIFSRYVTISGYVRQFWPKTVAQVIDGVEFDGISVSGVGGANVSVATTGDDPLETAWIGNLDTIRRRP